MRVLSVALMVFAFVNLANAAPLAHDDPFANFKFPRELGGYVFQNHVTYPRVGLGYGLNYSDRTGTTVTISIYDLNTTGVADGTADAHVVEEFGKLNESIVAVAQQGGYQSVSELDNVPLLSKAWLQVNHELARADGRRAYAYSFIRAQNGKFVKIRVTAPTQRSYERLPLFLLDVSRAIGLLKSQPAN